jgi:hypothetical protein
MEKKTYDAEGWIWFIVNLFEISTSESRTNAWDRTNNLAAPVLWYCREFIRRMVDRRSSGTPHPSVPAHRDDLRDQRFPN